MRFMKIDKFSDFKILHIFDLDNTLVYSPNFEELVIPLLKENINFKDLVDKCFGEIGVSPNEIRYVDGRIFIEDKSRQGEWKWWVRKGDRIYLLPPSEFSLTDESLPKNPLKLKELYDSVSNKCIVTARPEILRGKIEGILNEFGFSEPNYGLYMYPSINWRRAGEWKGETIVSILKTNKFTEAIFYDDNSKYIKAVKKIMNMDLPNFNIKYVKI